MWPIAKRQLRIPGLHGAVAPIKRSAYVRVLQNRECDRDRLPQVRRGENRDRHLDQLHYQVR